MAMSALVCLTLSGCSSGLPDPGMLQSALLSRNGKQQLTTGSTIPAERSVASQVLTAVAVERVTGETTKSFSLHK